MGPMSYLVNKLVTKLEDRREEKERARERQRSYTPSPVRRWSQDPPRGPRRRTESYDERHRRHTDPESGEDKFKLAGYEFQANKVNKGDNSSGGRNSGSESNLADARESRDVILNPGDRRRGRDESPRRSDSRLSRLRSRSQEESSRSKGNNRAPSRSRSNKKYPASKERANKEDIPPVPPIPPQWTEARNKAPGPGLVRNRQAEEYQRLQREAAKKNIEKQAVDWDRLKREKNDEVKLAAEKREREAAGREAAPKSGKRAEKQRREAEKEARRRCEWEKAQKRMEAEEAEKRTNADALLVLEISRADAAKRANEAKRLAAFGAIGKSNRSKTNLASPRERVNVPKGWTEQQRRPPAWSKAGPPAQTSGSGPQGRLLGSRETNPVPHTPAPARNGQQNGGQQPRHPARSNSEPITVQQAGNRAPRPRPKPPVVAPLSEENLRAQRGNFADQVPVSELNRGLGDMTRTIIEGFLVPTELQSRVEDDDEEAPEKRIS